MAENNYLESAIYEYIQNNQQDNIDSVDIVTHFKLRADITLEALDNLEKENKVRRECIFGIKHRYVLV